MHPFSWPSLPRMQLQNRADPSLALCPPDHPFINASQLEAEGAALLQQLLSLLFKTQCVLLFLPAPFVRLVSADLHARIHRNPEILSAILNCLVPLVKQRPSMIGAIVTTLGQWTANHLQAILSASQIRSVEKGIRAVLMHILRLTSFTFALPCSNSGLLQKRSSACFHSADKRDSSRANISHGYCCSRRNCSPCRSESEKGSVGIGPRFIGCQEAESGGCCCTFSASGQPSVIKHPSNFRFYHLVPTSGGGPGHCQLDRGLSCQTAYSRSGKPHFATFKACVTDLQPCRTSV